MDKTCNITDRHDFRSQALTRMRSPTFPRVVFVVFAESVSRLVQYIVLAAVRHVGRKV